MLQPCTCQVLRRLATIVTSPSKSRRSFASLPRPLDRSTFWATSTISRVRQPITGGRGYATAPAAKGSKKSGRAKQVLGATSLLALSGLVYAYYSSQDDARRLDINHFIPLTVTSITHLTPETALFKFALPDELLPLAGPPPESAPGQPIKSIYLMQPDLQIQRPYTPVSSAVFEQSRAAGDKELQLVVKRYPDGEVSRWMHRLQVGDEVRMRGPTITWNWKEGQADEVVFIVGGTGITPAYQFVEHQLAKLAHSPSTPIPKLSIIYSSPTPSTILLQSGLDKFAAQYPGQVEINYFVDAKDPPGVVSQGVEGKTVGRVSARNLKPIIGLGDAARNVVVVVCGPDPMVNAVAGPRARNQSQGPVGGILKELGYTSTQVVKL